MRLADKQTFLVTPLLSNNFPDNFNETAQLLFEKYPDDFSLEEPPGLIRDKFFDSIFKLDWSPDSRYLAFAGEIDGPSLDLYLLDVVSRSIKRLTDGPEQVEWITWSPDAQWIFHESDELRSMGSGNYHVADMQDETTRTLVNVNSFGGPNISVGWASNTLYTIYTVANGITDKAHLRNIDIVGDRVVELWPGQFTSFAYDSVNNILAVSEYEIGSTQQENKIAIILLNPVDGEQRIVKAGLWDINFWGYGNHRFIATSKIENDPGVIAIQQDGAIAVLSGQSWMLAISPDKESVAFYDNRVHPGLEVYFSDNADTLEITDMPVDNVIWRQDSEGIFFISEGNSYYAALSGAKPVLVESGVGNVCEFSAPWIDGR